MAKKASSAAVENSSANNGEKSYFQTSVSIEFSEKYRQIMGVSLCAPSKEGRELFSASEAGKFLTNRMGMVWRKGSIDTKAKMRLAKDLVSYAESKPFELTREFAGGSHDVKVSCISKTHSFKKFVEMMGWAIEKVDGWEQPRETYTRRLLAYWAMEKVMEEELKRREKVAKAERKAAQEEAEKAKATFSAGMSEMPLFPVPNAEADAPSLLTPMPFEDAEAAQQLLDEEAAKVIAKDRDLRLARAENRALKDENSALEKRLLVREESENAKGERIRVLEGKVKALESKCLDLVDENRSLLMSNRSLRARLSNISKSAASEDDDRPMAPF